MEENKLVLNEGENNENLSTIGGEKPAEENIKEVEGSPKKEMKETNMGSTVGFSVAGLLLLSVYSYIEFLGLMYLTNGNSKVSIITTGAIAIVLIVSSFILPHVKSSNEAFVSKRRTKLTLVTFIFFFLSSMASLVGVMHFFKIQKSEPEIQALYESAVEEAKSIYPKYDMYASARIAKYEKVLDEAIKNKKNNPTVYQKIVGDFPGSSDEARKTTLVKSLRRTLLPSDNTIQTTFNEWLETVGNANVWNVSFVYNVNLLDKRITTYIGKLKNLSSRFYHPGEEEVPFEYPDYVSNNEIQQYFSFEGFSYSNRMLGSWFLTMFALLMPWFRDIRSKKDL